MTTYRTLHTRTGLAKLNAARLGGPAVAIAQMAFGDGNGNPVQPDDEATGLVRERFRTAINRVYQDPENPLVYYAEGIIPAASGGFVIREIALVDTDNDLFAIANTPDNYQPLAAEGAIGDGIYRVAFAVANAGNVTVVLDPATVVASRAWVLNSVTAAQVIPGGTTGQALTKASNADGDYDWTSPEGVQVLVSSLEERQTLAADQTVVDLATTTTVGLAVYIDGERIARGPAADEWQPDPAIETRLVLGQAYAAGTRLIGAQNEPAGNIPLALERSANLGDLASKPAARGNLDVFSRAETRQMAPAGMIAMFGGTNAPTGWLKCNGAQVSKTAYPDLYASIGDHWTPQGATPSTGSFYLPDLRGAFLRAADDGRGLDPDRTVGSRQEDAVRAHKHAGKTASAGEHNHDSSFGEAAKHLASAPFGTSKHRPGNRNAGSHGSIDNDNYAWNTSTDGAHSHDFETSEVGGTETRPVNYAGLCCIKY